MLTENQILEFALKGIDADIDELEKTINQGKRLLLEYERGQKPTTPKTPQEIKDIIQEKKTEIEKLSKIKSDLQWKMIK